MRLAYEAMIIDQKSDVFFMSSRGVRSKERQRVVGKNQCKGRQITLPKILLYESGFKIVYFTSTFSYLWYHAKPVCSC